MKLKLFQIDSFASKVFQGNPAAVCPLDKWLPDDLLQKIANENNLSETAFFVKSGEGYELRWFTPDVEVAMCGHATLAAAWVLVNEMGEIADPIRFSTLSGELRVSKLGSKLILDFPAQVAESVSPPDNLLLALGIVSNDAEVFAAADFLVVVKSEDEVRKLTPDFPRLKGLPLRGVIVTAPGNTSDQNSVDFVSRWFGPNIGVDEDPVTGSAHTTLVPYWATRLNKSELTARQISARGGELFCTLKNSRVLMAGSAVKFMEGEVLL